MRKQSNRQQLVALNFRVPLDLRRRLKIIAASHSITMTDLLIELLERFEREGLQSPEQAETLGGEFSKRASRAEEGHARDCP